MGQFIANFKTITTLTTLLLLVAFVPQSQEADAAVAIQANSVGLKQDALQILDLKCNTCHRKQNPRRVFTPGNMSELAPKIYKQVFVKKRMPKGKTRLTDEEYNMLKKWLFTENIN